MIGPRRTIRLVTGLWGLGLLVLTGCQGQEFRGLSGYRLGDNRDLKLDMSQQLDSLEQKWKQTRSQLDQAVAETANLQKQLGGQQDIQSLLQQRVDNLLRENQQLHQELTSVVMNAAGDSESIAASAIEKLPSTSARGDAIVPASLERSLSALADQHAGVAYDAKERAIRIISAELFSAGDEIRPAGRRTLTDLASILNSNDARPFNFLVVAHAPPGGTVPKELVNFHPTVWHLTAHQAIAVEQFLEEAGVAPTRVGIISYAGQQPLMSGRDDASQRANARVEVYLTPPDPAER
jgi:outer membrane protein OmpA-like peptidoglycan-associated protein